MEAHAAYALRRRQAARRWTPIQASGLVAWYDFQRPMGRMYQESTRTTLVNAASDPVGYLGPVGSAADTVNKGYVQATGGSRPPFDNAIAMTSTLELTGPTDALLPVDAPPWTLAGVARYDELPGTNDPLVRMAANVEVRGNTDGSTLTIGVGAVATPAAIDGIAVGQWFGFVVVYGVRDGSNNLGRLWVNDRWSDVDIQFTTNEAASSRKPELAASTKQRTWRTLALFGRDLSNSRDMRLLTDYLNRVRTRT